MKTRIFFRFYALLILLTMHFEPVLSQSPIPLGTWRVHIPFNEIKTVAVNSNFVYGASSNGIMMLDRMDRSVQTYSRLSGLSGSAISHINTIDFCQCLMVAYEDGNLDVIERNVITNFNLLKNSTSIVGSKKINHINIAGNTAYLSTDYGIAVFDIQKKSLVETWRDLGTEGSPLAVYKTVIVQDSIFAATVTGIIAGSLNANLLDHSQWKRFQHEELSAPGLTITSTDNTLYAVANNAGLFIYADGVWTKENILEGETFRSLEAYDGYLIISTSDGVWLYNEDENLRAVTSDLITAPNIAMLTDDGDLWIGDSNSGLVNVQGNSATSILSNGPQIQRATGLFYHNKFIYAFEKGYNHALQPLGNSGKFDFFHTGNMWLQETLPVNDVTDITFVSSQLYVASFGDGLLAGETVYDNNNSPLLSSPSAPGEVRITSLAATSEGLWVANYGTEKPLHLLSGNTWESFSFGFNSSRFPLKLTADLTGNIWAILNPSQGGGLLVFSKRNNASAYITDQAGAGSLPSRSVRSLVVDKDGYVWIGTDQGIAYYANAFSALNQADVIRPIYENQYLLRTERVSAIAVDGGNRKWIGTHRGAWLFNETADEVIYHFTTANSPLLSDVIHDISIHAETGEVFFATDEGIVSFRADATESNGTFDQVKIFPNPVTARFSGIVGISGLATGAFVKITDVSGKLIFDTRANGGTATWNVRDYNGKRAASGIYLIFAATEDGSESMVGKIAVID